jgi:hypothetical protein
MARKRLTDEERRLYDDMHSRADLTEDEPDDGDDVDAAEDDDDIEALVIRGPGIKKILGNLLGTGAESNKDSDGESVNDGKSEKDTPPPRKDPKPPTRSRYFGGSGKD